MEKEYFIRLYSIRRIVIMVELTNTRKRNEETIFNSTNRWRHASLNFKYWLSDVLSIEMCIQGGSVGNTISPIDLAQSKSMSSSSYIMWVGCWTLPLWATSKWGGGITSSLFSYTSLGGTSPTFWGILGLGWPYPVVCWTCRATSN